MLGEHERAEADDSVTGVAGVHASGTCRRSSAGSSVCLGRIGRLSSSRRPGAKRAGNVRTTVAGSGALDLERLAWTMSGWRSELSTPGRRARRTRTARRRR